MTSGSNCGTKAVTRAGFVKVVLGRSTQERCHAQHMK
jgi:hypothetical protein